jgi:hypothetical protein
MVLLFMFSDNPSPGTGEKTSVSHLSDAEAKRARERARYLSMSPEQVETLRQNKKNYYLNKKGLGASPVGSIPTDKILDPINGLFQVCSFIIDVSCFSIMLIINVQQKDIVRIKTMEHVLR